MTVNTSYNYNSGGYYQLASQQNTGTDSISGSQAAALKAAAADTGFSSAYLLDLSGDASAYLSGLVNGGGSSSDSSGFVLTSSQKDTLVAILKKYAGEPQTQDTFNKIQDDLKKAGLDPDHMAAKQQAKDFNPAQVLIDILNGNDTQNSGSANDLLNPQADTQQKYDNQKSGYLSQLIDLWKNLADANAADSEDAIAPTA